MLGVIVSSFTAQDIPNNVPWIRVSLYSDVFYDHSQRFLDKQDSLHAEHAALTFQHLVSQEAAQRDPGARLAEAQISPSWSEVKARVTEVIQALKAREAKLDQQMSMADNAVAGAGPSAQAAAAKAAVLSSLQSRSRSCPRQDIT